MRNYHTESFAIETLQNIKQEWINLQERSDCSYFLSWGWVGTWLEHIAIDLQPVLVKVWDNENLIGMGLFVPRKIKRRKIFSSQAMFLNEYPFDGRNMVIEYNGLLAEKGLEGIVYAETVSHLCSKYTQYNEFNFGAVENEPGRNMLEKCADDNLKYIVNEQSACWQVDLDMFEPELDSYLAGLSKNTREQIRRSLRLYKEQAPVTLSEAETIDEALAYFESLKDFHTKHWESKGKSGSFANPMWVSFQQMLIKKRFEFGEIQMIKISNSHGDIAYLYNYIWRRRIYVLQMGFNYQEDKRFKPGYVAHTLAIVHNRNKGMLIYDFMHGESRYKSSLGSGRANLYWVVLQRPRLKFTLEHLAVGIIRHLRK